MKLKVRNFRGAAKADIELSPIALIAGRNESGKSSIAQALQALLTGDVVPITDLRKADAAMLIHAGTGSCTVSLETEQGRAAIEYPQAKRSTEGDAPSASPVAAGMVTLAALDRRARADLLNGYLHAEPTRADVEKSLEPLGLPPANIDRLWGMIESTGWDAAHASAKDKGIELKGAWREVTGENYGPTKAERWMPDAWESDLEGASEESLTAVLTQASEFRDAAIAHTAISEEKLAELREQAGRVDALKQTVADIAGKVENAGKAVAAATDALNAAPKPDEEIKTIACPHCSEPLVIRGDALMKAPPDSTSEENTHRRAVREELVRAMTKASRELQRLNDEASSARSELARAESAAAELGAAQDQKNAGASADALERARRDVDSAQGRLAAFRAKTRADRLHASIVRNQGIVSMLASDGLRLLKLRGALERFNSAVSALANVASWPAAELTENLGILYRGTAWALCSESGRFRANALIQAALAEIDGSSALVIDGADVLDSDGRNGLFRMLKSLGRPVLVCMTMPDRQHVPDLARAHYGRSYWIERGAAERTGTM